MNNEQFQDWIKKSRYAKAESLTHKVFDNSGKRKIGRVTTRQLLQEAFEAGKKAK